MFDKLKKTFRVLLTPWFLFKVVAILAFTEIHEYTKYKLCRTISDLFYWPDGFCVDTVVVSLFFIFAFLILYDYVKIIKAIYNVDDVE